MNKTLALVVVLSIIFWLIVTAFIFEQSLPLWCANPQGSNWIAQPLC